MTCDECFFYQAHDDYRGSCHRHAPGPIVGPLTGSPSSTWPLVGSSSWCGEGDLKVVLVPDAPAPVVKPIRKPRTKATARIHCDWEEKS